MLKDFARRKGGIFAVGKTREPFIEGEEMKRDIRSEDLSEKSEERDAAKAAARGGNDEIRRGL